MVKISQEIKEYMSKLGKKGGSKSSDKKKAASQITLAKARAIRWQNKEKKMKTLIITGLLIVLSGCAWAQSYDPNQQGQNTITGTPLGAAPHCNGWNC